MEKVILTILIMMELFLIIMIILQVGYKDKLLIKARFKRVMSITGPDERQIIKQAKLKRKNKLKEKDKEAGRLGKLLTNLENELSSAGVLMRSSEYLAIWAFASIGIPLIFYLITRNAIVVMAILVIGFALPPLLLHRKKQKRVDLFEKQLVEAIAVMCTSLKTGLTLQQSMMSIANEMPEPISKEFGRVLREISLGSNLEKALFSMADRLNSKNFMIIVSAISIQRQIGGNLSEVLTNLSTTIKERFRIKSEIKVMTATGRTSGLIVGFLPIAMLLMFMLINPSFVHAFFDSTAGIILISVAALLETIGFLFIRKIVNIKY
ncbi:type II secretion system F family protein [Dehalobacter sp. DCM]|uniref:type II secretion system F family protein n=1 Tax=Dehalobacter sp. DCM TaxID=2907827 RepID=UPI0030820ABF|nr:type II secretion system F family protein [Dehalobacter sp. DCM]